MDVLFLFFEIFLGKKSSMVAKILVSFCTCTGMPQLCHPNQIEATISTNEIVGSNSEFLKVSKGCHVGHLESQGV